MKKMIAETNGYNMIYTEKDNTVYYVCDGELGLNTGSVKNLIEQNTNEWDLDNFKQLPTDEFYNGVEKTHSLSDYIYIIIGGKLDDGQDLLNEILQH